MSTFVVTLREWVIMYWHIIVCIGLSVVIASLLWFWIVGGNNEVVLVPETESASIEVQPRASSSLATVASSTPTSSEMATAEEITEPIPEPVVRTSAPIQTAPITVPAALVEPDPEPPTTPVTANYSVTATHKQTLLQTHNAARAAVGVAPLGWSNTVAASAQTWADTLEGQGCKMRHSSNRPYGENLAYAWTSRSSAPLDPANAVDRWVAEQSDYTYWSNTCAPGAVCGHYTQVVWAESTQLGCGVAVCADDGFTQLWVCQYNPPGNFVGERPY